MTFSENQKSQIYVVNTVATGTPTAAGQGAFQNKYADNGTGYLSYFGVDNLMRSDIIEAKNLLNISATSALKQKRTPNKYVIQLNANVNSGAPLAGQDYLIRVAFKNFVGTSDEDQYFKYGVVHATSDMAANPYKFYANMAHSLVMNFSREVDRLVNVYLGIGSTVSGGDDFGGEGSFTKAPTTLKYVSNLTNAEWTTLLNGTTAYTEIIIEEAPQKWVQGKMSQDPVNFRVTTDQVTYNGDEVIWGKVYKGIATVVGTATDGTTLLPAFTNTPKIADLEWFLMGERGDYYRGMGYPYNIDTKMLVDTTNKFGYHIIDIHYAYVGANHAVQKSEKDIVIVVPATSATATVDTDAGAIYTNIKAFADNAGIPVVKDGVKA